MRTQSEYMTQQTARFLGQRARNLAALADPTLPAWARRAHKRMASHAETRLAMLADAFIMDGGFARLPRSL